MNKGKVIAVYDCDKYTNVVLSDGRTIKSKWGAASKSIEGQMISWTTTGNWDANEWFSSINVSTAPKKADQYRSALEANATLSNKIEELEIKIVDYEVALGEMPNTINQLNTTIHDLEVQLNLANAEVQIAKDKQKNAEEFSKKTVADCHKQIAQNSVEARTSATVAIANEDAARKVREANRAAKQAEIKASSAATLNAIIVICSIGAIIAAVAYTGA